MRRRILVFARAPLLGEVKTRLDPALSAQHILQLHQALVSHTLASVFTCAADEVQLWVDQQPEHEFFQSCLRQYPPLKIHQQHGADLGERMAYAIAHADDDAAQVLIGSDCPSIDESYLNGAFDHLDSDREGQAAQVVLGPAKDGGYVLIGTCLKTLPVFKAIDWGSDQVLKQTRAQLERAHIDYALLQPLQDIDRPEDLPEAARYGLPLGDASA